MASLWNVWTHWGLLMYICVSELDHQWFSALPLRWRHNARDGVPNHQPHDCLLNCLFRRRSNKTSKLCVTSLCAGNSPGTGEFPAQMASNAENVSIWWRHHAKPSPKPMIYQLTEQIKLQSNLDQNVDIFFCSNKMLVVLTYFFRRFNGYILLQCRTVVKQHHIWDKVYLIN